MAIACVVMGLFNLGLAVPGWAQIVTNTYPQNRFYIMPTGYANPGTNWDVLTNCDMLEDPQGDMKTGTWSMANNEVLNGYSISDAIGRRLRKGRLSSGEAINLSGLAPRFYMLHAAREDGAVSTHKFTVK